MNTELSSGWILQLINIVAMGGGSNSIIIYPHIRNTQRMLHRHDWFRVERDTSQQIISKELKLKKMS